MAIEPQQIRVLIADDHKLVRKGLTALLKSEPDIEVVGEANDGMEAIELSRFLAPDVVLMDIQMPKLNGLEAAAQFAGQSPSTKIIFLTQYENIEYIKLAMESGANGYLLKNSVAIDLAPAIRAVWRDERFFTPSISKQILELYLQDVAGLQLAQKTVETDTTFSDDGKKTGSSGLP